MDLNIHPSLRDLCYNNGISFIAERGSGAICFFDFEKRVQVDVKSLKKKPDLISHLQRFGININGNVPVLRERLKQHLEQIAVTYND